MTTFKSFQDYANTVRHDKPEARRISCEKGHTLAVLKVDSEDDEFQVGFMDQYHGTCIYCGSPLKAEKADISEFDSWASREDGRYQGCGAP